MWTIVLYDLPCETKKQRKAAILFRKILIKDGFEMFQFSMYIRHSVSVENADVHKRRVQSLLPKSGKVTILQITDKQFANMDVYFQSIKQGPPDPLNQLEMF